MFQSNTIYYFIFISMTTCFGYLTTIRTSLQILQYGTCSYMNICFFKFSIPKCYNLQVNTIRQSITQHLFYIQRYIYIYICQGNMFRPSRSYSGPPRKQIQELFSFPALWDPKTSPISVTETKVL